MTRVKVVRNFIATAGRLVGPGGYLELHDREAKRFLASGQVVSADTNAPAAGGNTALLAADEAELPEPTPKVVPAKKRK